MQNTQLSTKVGVYAIPGVLSNNTADAIITMIEGKTGFDIRQKTRKRGIVEARQIAMRIIKQETRMSLAQIGSVCGGKDHCTVLHACKTVDNLIETNKEYVRNYKSLFEFYGLIE